MFVIRMVRGRKINILCGYNGETSGKIINCKEQRIHSFKKE